MLLHQLLPPPVPEVTPKLKYLEAHLGDFDTLFIGSSRIYHGISPKAFDEAMAAGGVPAHSFNLGINAMWPPESLHMVRMLIGQHPPRLRRVFMEIALDRGLPTSSSLTVRDVYFQDIDELMSGLRRAGMDYRCAPRKERWSRAWADAARSATLFARNELNMGRLTPMPADEPDMADPFGPPALGPDTDGFFPKTLPMTAEARAKIEAGVQAIRQQKLKTRPVDPINESEYARVRDLLARHGVELLLVATPVTTREYHAGKDTPPGVKLLSFDDPDRYPELYTPEHRFDAGHLNGDGAIIFSRELAQAYLAGR